LTKPYVDSFIALDTNGTFFDPKIPVYPIEPSVLIPYRDINGKAFQVFLSDYTINTFFTSLFRGGRYVDITDMLKPFIG